MASSAFPVRLLSRTSSVTDWKCQRARYYANEIYGRGISKSTTSLALFTGIVLHDSLAAIATYHQRGEVVPIDTIATLAFNQIYDNLSVVPEGEMISSETEEFAKEQGSLTEGIIRGYFRHVWPRLLIQYPKIVAIEQEVEYKLEEPKTCHHCSGSSVETDENGNNEINCPMCGGLGSIGGFIFMAKPDLILEDPSGEWHYIEFKSTSSKKEQWVNSWDSAVQLHSSIKAVEQTLGVAPIDVTIVGMYKGWVSYGRQSSPFCYAYKKSGNPPFTQDSIAYDYKSGYKRYPTWELPEGVKKWVEEMPEEVLANQFPLTAPIYVQDDLVNGFFRQRLMRETEIRDAMVRLAEHPEEEQEILDRSFAQTFESCSPSFGYSCEYKKLCFSHVSNPLEEGYQLRDPHHKREADIYAAD